MYVICRPFLELSIDFSSDEIRADNNQWCACQSKLTVDKNENLIYTLTAGIMPLQVCLKNMSYDR